jgi:hypothetical protein
VIFVAFYVIFAYDGTTKTKKNLNRWNENEQQFVAYSANGSTSSHIPQ